MERVSDFRRKSEVWFHPAPNRLWVAMLLDKESTGTRPLSKKLQETRNDHLLSSTSARPSMHGNSKQVHFKRSLQSPHQYLASSTHDSICPIDSLPPPPPEEITNRGRRLLFQDHRRPTTSPAAPPGPLGWWMETVQPDPPGLSFPPFWAFQPLSMVVFQPPRRRETKGRKKASTFRSAMKKVGSKVPGTRKSRAGWPCCIK